MVKVKMANIDTSPEELEEALGSLDDDMMEKMPDALKNILQTIKKVVESDRESPTAIEIIKGWVNSYDKNDVLDKLIANIVQEVIGRCGQAVSQAVRASEDGVSGEEAIMICAKQLKKMVDNFEKRKKYH
jgi:hypothetical protein